MKKIDALVYLAGIAAILSIVSYLVLSTSESESTISQPTRYTIEGKIVSVEIGDRLLLTWENEDGTFVRAFNIPTRLLPIGEEIKLTYVMSAYTGFPSIINVEIKGVER